MAIQPLPGSSGRSPRRIGAGIDAVVRSLKLPAATSVTSIFGSWADVVGDELAGCCRPTGLRDGTLTITAIDQAWATELQWMESTLLERCQAELGDGAVQAVRVVAQR